jgi:hypothetical protein
MLDADAAAMLPVRLDGPAPPVQLRHSDGRKSDVNQLTTSLLDRVRHRRSVGSAGFDGCVGYMEAWRYGETGVDRCLVGTRHEC